MLGKLLKYEFKSTSRVLWFLYAGLIVVALLFGLVIRANIDFDMTGISPSYIQSSDALSLLMTILLTALGLIYGLLIYAILITTTIVIVMRFYRNMLGGEGYLMHTLPVKTSSLILSKLITSCFWMLIAGAVVLISTIVLGLSSGVIGYIMKYASWDEFVNLLRDLREFIGISGWQLILLVFVSMVSSIITYYVSMAIGNLANNHKFLFSVLAYVGIGIIISTVISITSIVGGRGLIESYEIDAFMSYNLWMTIGTQAVVGIVGFFLTNYLLSKKLNLA